QQRLHVAERIDDVDEVLNCKAAGLQAAVGDEARVQNEEKGRQNEVGQDHRRKQEQHLRRVAQHRVHRQALALERLGAPVAGLKPMSDSAGMEAIYQNGGARQLRPQGGVRQGSRAICLDCDQGNLPKSSRTKPFWWKIAACLCSPSLSRYSFPRIAAIRGAMRLCQGAKYSGGCCGSVKSRVSTIKWVTPN